MLAAGHLQTQQILQEALAKEHECFEHLGLFLYFQKTVEYWEGICYIVLENSAFRGRDWRLFPGKKPAPLWRQNPTYPADPTHM